MKKVAKLLIVSVFCLGFGFGAGYLFIFPPKVKTVSPSPQALNIAPDSSLIIKFNKPVKRQELQHYISPEAYGEWKFEDPLIKNHFFRTLVFTPAVKLKPDTVYQVKLENIINPFGIGGSGEFVFNFKTKPAEKVEPEITLLDIPLDWQDHPLSCEAANLKMALTSKGIYVSEQDIMDEIGYDKTIRQSNVWGDPHRAYVGNIDGKMCVTGYGVYWQPIARAANKWREAGYFSNGNLNILIREIESGNPVVVWGVLPVEVLHDCSWYTPEGEYVKAIKEAHVRLVVGFVGSATSPSKIILNDPLAGQLYWDTSYFLENWRHFDYSGVVVR